MNDTERAKSGDKSLRGANLRGANLIDATVALGNRAIKLPKELKP